MKSLMYSLLIISLFSVPRVLKSQVVSPGYDQLYGLDQTLCNGIKYSYFAPAGSNGHQYLVGPYFTSGSVTIRGKEYKDVTLNYDILNQKLLLLYADDRSPKNIIEVSRAWLTGFSMAGKDFELLSLEKEPQFYQVLGEGNLRILCFWRKNITLNEAIGSANYVFTSPIRDRYVLQNGQLRPFTSKGSLLRIFDPGLRPQIKSYMHKNKIRVKKASDKSMADLIIFIGNLK